MVAYPYPVGMCIAVFMDEIVGHLGFILKYFSQKSEGEGIDAAVGGWRKMLTMIENGTMDILKPWKLLFK